MGNHNETTRNNHEEQLQEWICGCGVNKKIIKPNAEIIMTSTQQNSKIQTSFQEIRINIS